MNNIQKDACKNCALGLTRDDCSKIEYLECLEEYMYGEFVKVNASLQTTINEVSNVSCTCEIKDNTIIKCHRCTILNELKNIQISIRKH